MPSTHAYEEEAVEPITWETRHPALIGRLAGIAGVLFVLLSLTSGLGGPQYGTHDSTTQILSWVTAHSAGFPVTGFVDGLSGTILAVFVLLLVSAARGSGLLARIAVSTAAAVMAIDWVAAGIYYALADAAGRSRAASGIVALFSLRNSMTYADGFAAGIAILALSALQFQAHALPRPLVWLGLLTGAWYVASAPIQLSVSHSPAGATGPIGVVLVLVWFLAVAAALLIKPVWAPGHAAMAPGTAPAR